MFGTEQDANDGRLVSKKYDPDLHVASLTPGDEYPADITYA